MSFGRIKLSQVDTRKTVKMAVKVANGRATPCGSAVVNAARDIITAIEKMGRPQRLLPTWHSANECKDNARRGDWIEAVRRLQEATTMFHVSESGRVWR